jgi:hypothetical protein
MECEGKKGKKHRLRVFKKRVHRKISGPTTDELTCLWRKLHK